MNDIVKYSKNYLKQVIFRVDFDEILILKQLPTNFQEKIRAKYPSLNHKKGKNIQFAIQPKTTFSESEFDVFEFQNNEKQSKLSLSSSFFIIERNSYDSFNHFKNEILENFNKFESEYSPIVKKRIGLRYINIVNIPSGNPFDWSNYIDDRLCSSFQWNENDKGLLSKAISQLEFKHPDCNLRFVSGLFNPEYPGKITRKEFVLDYDCYSEDISENFNISSYIDNFHSKIEESFELSIKDGLRAEMRK